MSQEENEQLLRLREKVLQAEQERLEGAETFSIGEARKYCRGEIGKKQIREMVLESYCDIAAGKGRDCNEFFDELEEKHSNI